MSFHYYASMIITFDWTSFLSSLIAPIRSLMALTRAASGHSGQSGELIGMSPEN